MTKAKTVASVKTAGAAKRGTSSSLRGLAGHGDGVSRKDGFRAEAQRLQIEKDFNARRMQDVAVLEHIASIKKTIAEYIARATEEGRSVESLHDVIGTLIVRVVDGVIFVVDGNCRTCALHELLAEGYTLPPIDLVQTHEDEAGRNLIMLRSAMGKDLTPLEKGVALVRLADKGMNYHEISRAVGNSLTAQRVEQLVLLARAPQPVLDQVAAGGLTADRAIELLRKHRGNAQAAEQEVKELVESKQGAKPVGRAAASVTVPKKAAEVIIHSVVKARRDLESQIKKLEKTGEEGWENTLLNVSLPASVVRDLLQRQDKAAASAKAAEAKAADDDSAE